MNQTNMQEFRAVYLEELEEQLQSMEEEVLLLEKEGETESGIQRLFRAAHTLKGSSAAMGYAGMKELTHEMEHILDLVRNSHLTVDGSITGLFFRCLDGIKQLQADIVNEDAERTDVSDLMADLKNFARQGGRKESQDDPVLSLEAYLALQEGVASGRTPLWVQVVISEDCEMKAVRGSVIDARLREKEFVVWTDLVVSEDFDAKMIRWLLTTTRGAGELGNLVNQLTDVVSMSVRVAVMSEISVAGGPLPADGESVDENVNPTAVPEKRPNGEKTKAHTVRVNVERLEQLMNLVGELVIDQTGIRQMEQSLRRKYGGDETVRTLGHLADHLTQTVGELQESVMKARMLPIEQLFNRFPRMVRDLAHTLGKQVELVLEGKDTELDRNLIEEVGDPLIHLIRNAVDHGIELPEERRKAGKPETGRLRIGASHEDNQVVIEIEDDGAGISADKIRESAVGKGIIDRAGAVRLSDRETIDLIFHPGFSTASKVSDVSGRGVGMDIVRTEIERLNGLIDIDTQSGRGTLFKIRIPLTLAIITGLSVQAGDRTFILPMNNVAEIVRADPASIRKVKGNPVLVIRNQVIPVAWLHDLFHYPKPSAERKLIPVVIIGRAEKRLAVAVDELLGNQDVVIKTLGAFVGQTEGISGATIMGNGKVSLILDAGGVMKLAGKLA